MSLITVGDEATDGDRPATPSGLRSDGETGALFAGLRWRGGLGWAPAAGGESTFDCPIEPLPIVYPGDVDFVRFTHRGGSLCVTVATPLTGEAQPSRGNIGGDDRFDCTDDVDQPLWEAPLYAVGDDGTCPEGTWLNPPDDVLPQALGLRSDALFFPNVAPGDHVLFLAPVCGRYAFAEPCETEFADDPAVECVPYALAIAVVPSQQACDRLHQDLQESL